MNLKHKYVILTVRILFGLFMLFSGISGLMAISNGMEGIPEPMQAFTSTLVASGMFHMIKITEIVVGVMFLFNLLPQLAAIVMAPVSIGIIVVNAMLTPAFLPMGIIVALFNIYFGYVYMDKYKPLFKKA